MSEITAAKAKLKKFYSSYEVYINPVLKFLLALIILSVLNAKIGYMGKIDNIVVVLILALVCSFLPLKGMALISAIFMLLHLYSLGIECAIVTAVVFMFMYLLYARFVPNETIVVLITPILFLLKIPYAIPIVMGLLGGPLSIISVSFGLIVAYLIEYISVNAEALTNLEDGNMMTRIRFIVDGLVGNKDLIVMVVVFAITLMIVYTIRRRPIKNGWTIAILAGVSADAFILLISKVMFGLDYSVFGILLGSIVAVLVCFVIQLFNFHVDYEKVENLQFEDDDYYYYVKAVPKIKTSETAKRVKRVPPTSHTTHNDRDRRGGAPKSNPQTRSSNGPRTVHTANGTSRTVKE